MPYSIISPTIDILELSSRAPGPVSNTAKMISPPMRRQIIQIFSVLTGLFGIAGLVVAVYYYIDVAGTRKDGLFEYLQSNYCAPHHHGRVRGPPFYDLDFDWLVPTNKPRTLKIEAIGARASILPNYGVYPKLPRWSLKNIEDRLHRHICDTLNHRLTVGLLTISIATLQIITAYVFGLSTLPLRIMIQLDRSLSSKISAIYAGLNLVYGLCWAVAFGMCWMASHVDQYYTYSWGQVEFNYPVLLVEGMPNLWPYPVEELIQHTVVAFILFFLNSVMCLVTAAIMAIAFAVEKPNIGFVDIKSSASYMSVSAPPTKAPEGKPGDAATALNDLLGPAPTNKQLGKPSTQPGNANRVVPGSNRQSFSPRVSTSPGNKPPGNTGKPPNFQRPGSPLQVGGRTNIARPSQGSTGKAPTAPAGTQNKPAGSNPAPATPASGPQQNKTSPNAQAPKMTQWDVDV